MIILSVGLRLYQEAKADSAAAKLKAMISVSATAVRDGTPREIPLADLVPGDVVQLAAGDMIPGDVRIVEAKDLFVTQGSLTGESFPVEKHTVETATATGAATAPLDLPTIAFLSTSVESGSASTVVVATGKDTYLGGMAESISEQPAQTAFDRDISRFTWLLMRFMFVMVPLVFAINALTKGKWSEAFFFAVAVAVGLTPEMLPMIVTVCLSKGAVAMSKKKVIVKRLNAIPLKHKQNPQLTSPNVFRRRGTSAVPSTCEENESRRSDSLRESNRARNAILVDGRLAGQAEAFAPHAR
jgi:Mg2+-importing ATPase